MPGAGVRQNISASAPSSKMLPLQRFRLRNTGHVAIVLNSRFFLDVIFLCLEIEITRFRSWKDRRVYMRHAHRKKQEEATRRQRLPEGTKGGQEAVFLPTNNRSIYSIEFGIAVYDNWTVLVVAKYYKA
jgi:hypothetical protein